MRLPDVRCECSAPVPMANKTHCAGCGFQLSRPAVEQIHGYPVIGARYVDRKRDGAQGRIILVDRGEGAYQRYVTALQFEGDDGWAWGHYFDDELEANHDFSKRVRRGY